MGPYRKSSGDIAGVELYQCPNVEKQVYPVYTNMAVSANFRGPAYPQGIFGIESLMDHIAYQLKMDPIEFRLKNMTRKYHDQLALHQLRPGRLRSAAAPKRSNGRSAGTRRARAMVR